MRALGQTVTPALVKSAWSLDTPQLELQLSGMAQHPNIDQVTLETDQGRLRAGNPVAADAERIQMMFDLTHHEGDKSFPIGHLLIKYDFRREAQQHFAQWMLNVAATTLLILVIAVSVTLLYNTLVTRRLLELSRMIDRITPEKLRSPPPDTSRLKLPGKRDELDLLTDNLRLMWETGGDALADAERLGQRFQAIFNGARDGILVADIATQRVMAVNPTLCEMLGYSQQQLLRLKIEDLQPTDQPPLIRERFQLAAEGKVKQIPELPFRRSDGGIFPIDITTFLLEFQGHPCVAGFLRDASERVAVQQELLTHRKQLQEQVAEQVLDLEQARRKAEASEAMLTRVIDAIPIRVFWKDLELRYLGCNRKFAQDAGFKHSSPTDRQGRLPDGLVRAGRTLPGR